MSTEHLLREFYNQMYRVHTQPGNVYDIGDHLHHLTVHKHLDQDPLIQFREAWRWVDQAGARLVADAGCGYGGFASSGSMMRLSPLNRSATPPTWRQRFTIGPITYGQGAWS